MILWGRDAERGQKNDSQSILSERVDLDDVTRRTIDMLVVVNWERVASILLVEATKDPCLLGSWLKFLC